jgi:hypothetical protein
MVPRPQFSIRLLLVIMASCSVTFAAWSWWPHDLIVLAATTIPLFWLGVGCIFLGATLIYQGDSWSLLSAILDVLGAVLCLISVFGFVLFLGILLLAAALNLLSHVAA